jgi:hypothetical protein
MYNQFNLCKLCDDEPEVYNGLCRTCLDSANDGGDAYVGGSHVEKFSHRKSKSRKRFDKQDSEIDSD